MRIALVHSFHRADVPSGEDVVVRHQIEALCAAGHEVTLVSRGNDEGRPRPVAAVDVATGRGPDPSDALRRARPDVVHVHNLFPNFGTHWLRRWDGPLVATLHNFRPICAAGTLLREGARCTDCHEHPWSGVRHRCFQGSRVATLPLAIAGRRGAAASPLIARADRLVAISARAVFEYAVAGVGGDRFTIVPNAVADVPPSDRPAEDRWVFAGRLSAEKGLGELLALWPDDRGLDVIGHGELAEALRAGPQPPGVRWLGGMDNTEVRTRLASYTGLVVPSLWPEAGPPLTYVEALAAGVPAVAFVGNGAADDIARHGTGVAVERRDGAAELALALKEVERDRDAYGLRARAAYEERFAPDQWVRALVDVYREAGA